MFSFFSFFSFVLAFGGPFSPLPLRRPHLNILYIDGPFFFGNDGSMLGPFMGDTALLRWVSFFFPFPFSGREVLISSAGVFVAEALF